MDINEFFATYRPVMRAVYRTTRDLEVKTYVWRMFKDPRADERTFVIPAGTEIIVCNYSNFGDGYSMKPLRPRKVFAGHDCTNRWFKCLYADMEHVRDERV